MIRLSEKAIGVIDRLEKGGFEAFAVGGCVRDLLMGIPAHDYDITTNAATDEIKAVFSDYKTVDTGIKHGTVTVVTEGDPVEITTYRTDGEYTDSRRPDSVEFTRNIEDDLSRRDFTVNAMAYNEKRGLVDLFGGRDDLSAGIIRAVGDPRKRFTEDALRIMRGFRFSAQLGFEIEKNTLSAALELSGRLKNIARERIGSEFLRLLDSKFPSKALLAMGDALEEVLPCQVPRERLALADALPYGGEERLAMLLYGQPREQVLEAAHALRLSNAQKSKILSIASAVPPKYGPPSIRRFLRECGEFAEGAAAVLTLLGKADPSLSAAVTAEKANAPCISVGGLAINGADLINSGLVSGRQVGEILSALLEKVIDDPSLNTKDRLLLEAEAIAKNKLMEQYHE